MITAAPKPPSLALDTHHHTEQSLPNHIAIIMDGNGRWAKARGLPRSAGHLRGIAAVRRAVATARKLEIRHLTLFAFSTENWDRDNGEVNFIMRLLERYLRREIPKLLRNGIRVRVLGERSLLPASLAQAAAWAEEHTKNAAYMDLVLAVSYSGQDDIVHATRRLVKSCLIGARRLDGIDRAALVENLMIPDLPQVDLLIRSGGEQRISNFLLWQLAYAELVFLPVLWPEFTEKDFRSSIVHFQSRQRRFGRTPFTAR